MKRRHRPGLLLVADRSNKRIQTFTLDGTHLGFVEDFPAPCHFNERNGVIVLPDLFARVTLIVAVPPFSATL